MVKEDKKSLSFATGFVNLGGRYGQGGMKMKEEWKQLFSKTGKLIYEGFTVNGKPKGAGTMYFANGNKYLEGVFDVKGLLYGREYYKNGNLRFEGAFMVNKGYGPNYPVYGNCYDDKGVEYYSGKISVSKSSTGYPTVKKPAQYGPVEQDGIPGADRFMWWDDDTVPRRMCFVGARGKKVRKDFIEFLEKNGFKCKEDGTVTRESTLKSIFPVTVDLDEKVYGHIGNRICAAAAVTLTRLFSIEEFMEFYESVNPIVIV